MVSHSDSYSSSETTALAHSYMHLYALVKGVFEYDSKSGELRRGELESSDNLTFIKSKEQLESKLRCIAGS